MSSAIGYAVLLTAGMLAVFFLIDRLHTRRGASTLEWCGVHDGRVVVLSSIYHSGGDGDPFHTGRLVWIDAGSGEVQRRLHLDRLPSAQQQRDNLLVISQGGQSGVLDLESGAISTGTAAFGRAAPALAQEGVSSATYRSEQDRFEVISNKGERVVVELAALGHKRGPARPQPRFAVARDREHAYSRLSCDGAACGDARLLEPSIVWQDEAACVIAQRVSLSGAAIELTCVGSDGKQAWTVRQDALGVQSPEDDPVACRPSFVTGSVLVLPLKAKRDKIVALSLADGTPRWSVAV
jgi:hypothetical protein